MNASITPAALEALAHEYDELGFEVELVRTHWGTPAELEYREGVDARWKTIFPDLAAVADADEAARYRDEIDGEADSAWRSQ